MHRQGRRFERLEHQLDLAARHCGRHLVGQHAGIAPAQARHADRCLVGADGEARLRHEAERAVRADELPVRQQGAGAGHDDGGIAQLIRVARAPDAVEKIWRGAHHRTNLPDLQRRVIALGQRADAHGHVDALLHHVHHAVDQQRIDLHVRVDVEVMGNTWNQKQLAEHYRRCHGEPPTRAHTATGGQLLGLFQFQQDAPAVLDITLASLGQAQAARAAGQQQRAETCLQRGDGASDAGRRNAQQLGAPGEALGLGHRQQHPHFLKPIHRHRLVFYGYVCVKCWALVQKPVGWAGRRSASAHQLRSAWAKAHPTRLRAFLEPLGNS